MDVSGVRNQTGSQTGRAWMGIFSGFCASLVGIGMARFAYTPLLPAIIGAHWFQPSAAAYLGAANLAGYLAGALAGRPLATRMTAPSALRTMMFLATSSFFACAYPLGFSWFFVWRFCAGLAGGVLMVLAAPTVLPHLPSSRRGLAGGVIFMGVGVGIAASGTFVPLLLNQGLQRSWVGLGAISLLLTLASWVGWPAEEIVPRSKPHKIPGTVALRALYVEYALNAVGLVPHMLFLVDFVARGLGNGIRTGAEYWVLFGLGAVVGPILSGHLADRLGFARFLRVSYLVEAAAVLLPALGGGAAWLMLSSAVVGAFTPGIVPLVLGRVHELLAHHPAGQNAAWSKATVSFATFQAAAAYGLSYIFAQTGDYRQLFIIGAVAMLLAFAIDVLAGGKIQ
ncbi:YbfB/YjiJ family MFS transporter [Acidiphilium cryptum]|uniref:Major facilitator superfamily MFS_1 n=1 Tax=Acidiphilium cryptum (strain JF-5) TaxID=349163 RepID=A5FTI9_ACICJ|nr:major facilitator superfamily MFS_1 [Acidiphilium cryptum JF-5]